MSKKPWGDERFYTYWLASERILVKEREIFEVCAVTSFTYKEIKEDLENCLEEAIDLENRDTLYPVSEAEKNGLREEMAKFIGKIDQYYSRIDK